MYRVSCTEEQCEKWSENPDSFVEEEDEDSFAYSVRISSQVMASPSSKFRHV
jgi:hypothetical protein